MQASNILGVSRSRLRLQDYIYYMARSLIKFQQVLKTRVSTIKQQVGHQQGKKFVSRFQLVSEELLRFVMQRETSFVFRNPETLSQHK